MHYNILEAHLQFAQGKLHTVTVLAEISKGDIRALQATPRFSSGFIAITDAHQVSKQTLQEVAAAGYELSKSNAMQIFPSYFQNQQTA